MSGDFEQWDNSASKHQAPTPPESQWHRLWKRILFFGAVAIFAILYFIWKELSR